MSTTSQVTGLATRVGAQFKNLPLPRVYSNFRRKPNGALTKLDSGHSLTISNTDSGINAPAVASGRWGVANLGAVSGAVYANADELPNKLLRLGGIIQFDNAPGTTAGEACAFVAWNDPDMVPFNQVDSHLHWAIGHASWSFGYVIDGVVTTLRTENQVLPYNTDIRCDAFIDGTSAYLFLNGVRYGPITDANIGSIAAKSAGWEWYRTATNQPVPYFVEAWADDALTVPGLMDAMYVDKMLNPPQRSATHGVAGNCIVDTLTPGDVNYTVTANADVYPGTTNVPFGRKILVSLLASGGTRTIAIHSAVPSLSGLTRSYDAANGKIVKFGFEYSALSGAWICIASGIT